jgi:hypothetical protein
VPEAPLDGHVYGRRGSTGNWVQALPIAGGTLTGALLLVEDPLVPMEAATKQYVDNNFLTTTAAAAQYLPLTGGTLTGALQVNNNIGATGSVQGSYMSSTGNINAVGTYTGGAVSVTGTVQSNNGRLIAQTGAGNPSVCVWDSGQQVAKGMFLGAGNTLYFGNMNGDGSYAGTPYGYFDASSNFYAIGSLTGAYVHSTGGIAADTSLSVGGDSIQHNIYCDGNLGLNFRGVYNSGYWFAFGWNGYLEIAINGGGQGNIWTQVQNDTRYVQQSNGNFFGFEANSGNLYMHGTDGTTWFYCLVAFTSDERIKQNIKPSAVDALSLLRQIPLDEFDLTDDVVGWMQQGQEGSKIAAMPAHYDIGMVAQKVQPLIPRAVFVAAQARTIDDVHASPPPDDVYASSPLPDDMLAINDQAFIPYLIRAVQQLATEVENLKTQGATP